MANRRQMFSFIVLVISCTFAKFVNSEQDWMDCPRACRCKWNSGRKMADCSNSQLNSLPTELSSEIQSLDMSHNLIHTLTEDAFVRIGLMNLQKIYLKECQIQDIHKDAFQGLKILIELDLSGNRIHTLHPDTFRDNEKLRMLYLNNNPIRKIEDGLFSNHTFLQNIELGECEISAVGHKTFIDLPVLSSLRLDGNNLTHLEAVSFEQLKKLRSLEIRNNPWVCDCHLRGFRDWVIKHNLYTLPTTCKEPPFLENQLWSSVDSMQFACKPQILWPPPASKVRVSSGSVTLGCKISGDPKPDTHWVFNNRIIENNTQALYLDSRYTIEESSYGNWYNLSISSVTYQNEGTYSCVAKSPGGIDERNITLLIRQSGGIVIGDEEISEEVWLLLIALLIGLVVTLVLSAILCCVCYRRNEPQTAKKGMMNGDVILQDNIESDPKKSFIDPVNPVQKPPRNYGDYSQNDSNATEMTELNRNLLDDGSVNGTTSVAGESSGERQSDVSTERVPSRQSQYTYLPPERLRVEPRYHHPPDLLSFPAQGPTCPVGSSILTDPNRPRIISPLHSPYYQILPNSGTLPFNRSQSPFSPTSSVPPVISQRQGYVTIPRRPRVVSCASAPSPTLMQDDPFYRSEPLYDNLGPRTTADGSSILSLPKIMPNDSARSKPLVQQPLYSHTLPHKKKYSVPKQQNNESEDFSPGPKSLEENPGVIKPLPLKDSPFRPLNDLCSTPVNGKNKRRSNWNNSSNGNRSIVLGGGQKRSFADKERLITSSPVGTIVKPKVPPKPPPKPKKGDALFECENEDGTEV